MIRRSVMLSTMVLRAMGRISMALSRNRAHHSGRLAPARRLGVKLYPGMGAKPREFTKSLSAGTTMAPSIRRLWRRNKGDASRDDRRSKVQEARNRRSPYTWCTIHHGPVS